MDARTDFEKYPASIGRGFNLVCLPEGAVTKRPGTRFINEVADSADDTALISFEPVSDQAYMIEAGDFYLRFFRNQARLASATTTTVITNGAFGTNITSWTDRSTGSASISHATDKMALNGSTNGFGWAEQALTVNALYQSTVHVVRFKVTGNPGSKITMQVGTATVTYNLVKATNLGIGWHIIAFTPGTGTVYLQFINEQNDTAYVDDVEVLSNVPLSLTSPYAAADVGAIAERTTQSADVLYLFHEDYAPYRLERRGDSSWSLVKAFFQDGPWLGVNPDTDLATQNLVSNGTFSGGIDPWTQSIASNAFVEYDSSSRFVFLRRFDAAGTAAIRQAIATPATTKVHVLHFQIVGGGTVALSIGTSAGGAEVAGPTAYGAGWYSVSFTPGGATTHLEFLSNQDDAIVGGVGGVFLYNTRARMLQASAVTGSVTVAALDEFRPFAATDVGRMVRLEHPGREPGWGIITAFATAQSVTVRVYRNFASTVPTETWRLGAWSDTTGWPKVGTFYQQRLIAARNAGRPQTIWGSQSGDFENMRPDTWREGATTVEDDDALDFTLSATRVSPIVWLVGSRRLIVGTSTGQWAVASKGPVLTPSDFVAEPQTSVKSADSAPVQIDTAAVFAHRAKRGVYDIGFSFEIDGFQASDVTMLARHITKGKVAQIVFQEEPFSQVWARLENGKLACMAYKRSQNVVGWTPCEIAPSGAVVESLAVIPGSAVGSSGQVYASDDRDELWMIVRRTIDGSSVRYIEVMEGYYEGPNPNEYASESNWKPDWDAAQLALQEDAFYVDCGLTYDGASTTTITGLDHLEGETVKIMADGAVQDDAEVSGGEVELRTAATKVQVGLGYDWVYRSMKLPYGSRTGSGVGRTKTVNALVFALLDAATFEFGIDLDGNLNFEPCAFRTAADLMTNAIPLFTGEIRKSSEGGFHTDPRIVAKGSQPLPWTLLGISPEVDASD